MKTNRITLSTYLNEKRPVNFRSLLAFTLFFIAGILLANILTVNIATLSLSVATLLLSALLYGRTHKRSALCALGLSFGILRLFLSNVSDGTTDNLLLSFSELFSPLRDKLLNATSTLFDNSADIINAILWGDKSNISAYQRNVFQGAGIAHILALSGLHISLFITFFSGIFPKKLRKTRLIFCLIFLILYGFITAFPSSLVRASVMSVLGLFATAFFLHYDRLTAISAAALIILFISPKEIFSLSFQMSFTAVLGITLVHTPLSNLLKRAMPEYLADIVSVTTAATLGVLPISVNAFSAFSVYTILGNILLLPFATALVFTSFFTVIIFFICPAIGLFIAPISQFIYFVIFTVSEFFASLPLSDVLFNIPPIFACLMYVAMFICSEYYIRPRHIKTGFLFVISALALISVLVI